MSAHPVIKNATTQVVRRTILGLALLTASDEIANAIGYATAWAAAKSGIAVHALTGLPSRTIEVVTDPHGKLTDYVHDRNTVLAKSVNFILGRTGPVFDKRPPEYVIEPIVEGALEAVADCYHEPARSGRTKQPNQWNGLNLTFQHQRATFRRPACFKNWKDMPETIELELTPPPNDETTALQQTSSGSGSGSGHANYITVRQSDPIARQPRNTEARQKQREAIREALATFARSWNREYLAARNERRDSSNLRTVNFPPGTNKLSKEPGVISRALPIQEIRAFIAHQIAPELLAQGNRCAA